MQLETHMVLVPGTKFIPFSALVTELVPAMCPRRRNETIIRVVHGKRRNEAMSQTTRPIRLASCLIHRPRKDVVFGRVFGNQEDLIFRPHSDCLG